MRFRGSTVAQRAPEMRCAVTRRSAATCSRSGVVGSARSVFVPPRTPAFARSTNDCSTGARATSFTVDPGSTCMRSKYSRHSSGTDCGFDRYFSYKSSMNGALPPKRYELSMNCRITLLMCASTLVDGLHVALGRPFVELPRPADLVFGIGDHLLPLCYPADGAREREDAGEHGDRDAERALHDARIEVDVRVELAAHEVVVLQRDALELDRQLEQAVVVQAELLQHLVASLAHELRARIVVLVDAVAEAHQAHMRALVLHLLDEL